MSETLREKVARYIREARRDSADLALAASLAAADRILALIGTDAATSTGTHRHTSVASPEGAEPFAWWVEVLYQGQPSPTSKPYAIQDRRLARVMAEQEPWSSGFTLRVTPLYRAAQSQEVQRLRESLRRVVRRFDTWESAQPAGVAYPELTLLRATVEDARALSTEQQGGE